MLFSGQSVGRALHSWALGKKSARSITHLVGLFEDAPSSLINTEYADEVQLDDHPRIVQEAMARRTALLEG